ncbi:MAG: helix-turn-helix domain-containing protein [Conexibacter sp.]
MPTTQQAREALAAAIRKVRGRKNLSQEQVAADAGLNRKTIGSLEREESLPSFLALAAIAQAMDVSLSELMGVYEKRLREP